MHTGPKTRELFYPQERVLARLAFVLSPDVAYALRGRYTAWRRTLASFQFPFSNLSLISSHTSQWPRRERPRDALVEALRAMGQVIESVSPAAVIVPAPGSPALAGAALAARYAKACRAQAFAYDCYVYLA